MFKNLFAKKILKPLSLVFAAAGGIIFLMAGNTGAGEGYTINSSEDYKDASELLSTFVPFVNASMGFCSAGDCNAHGAAAVDAWGNDTFWTGTNADVIGVNDGRKWVPAFGTTGNINFDATHMSDDVFGVGMGMPAEWRLELSESSSKDDCGGWEDAITTPGRITGRIVATEDNCTGSYTETGIGEAGPPWTPGGFEQTVIDITTFALANPGWIDPFAVAANSGACSTEAPPVTITPLNNPTTWTEPMWSCWFDESYGGAIPAHDADPDGVGDRQQYVDQIITNFIKTGDNYAQNFQSAMTFGDSSFVGLGQDFTRTGNCETDPAWCYTITDFRLEQGNTDNENTLKNAWTDSKGTLNGTQISGDKLIKNAFQINMTTMSAPSADPGGDGTTGLKVECGEGYTPQTGGCLNADKYNWSQNIEQNMEGFFYSCINCKSIDRANSFSAPRKLDMQTWTSVAVPTITLINSSGDASQTAW